jgi:hypothetical protein
LELKEDVDAREQLSITVAWTVDIDSAAAMWDVLDEVYFTATLLNAHIGERWIHRVPHPGFAPFLPALFQLSILGSTF